MPDYKPIVYRNLSEMPERVVSEGSMLWNKTGAWRYLRPKYENKLPPCNQGCPAGNDIEGFVGMVAEGQYHQAWQLLMEENPFPGVCGRVCYHPCESVCNRAGFDHSLAIHALERFVADHGAVNEVPPPLRPSTEKHVAVIGSGPAGLSAAYHLARLGHRVTVHEAMPLPGGMLRYGIPEYRLPKKILEQEINNIQSLGVEIRSNCKIGETLPWEDLQSFDALLICTGAHRHRELGLLGEELDRVLPALSFLKMVANGVKPDLGRKTMIIGGGNTAVDSARTAIRLGSAVSLCYQRSRREMPAYTEELGEAEREGARVQTLVQPVRIHTVNGDGLQVVMRKTTLGDRDSSGRRKAVPVPGSEYTVKTDTLICAIGEESELEFLPEGIQVHQGRIRISPEGETRLEGVFAAGDAACSVRDVATAIGSGKASACSIDAWLNGNLMEQNQEAWRIGTLGAVSVTNYLHSILPTKQTQILQSHSKRRGSQMLTRYDELNLNYFEVRPREKIRKLDILERLSAFGEVNLGLIENSAQNEAARCFHCGVCNQCDNCYVYCPDIAVSKNEPEEGGYTIDMNYCKGCGICVYECPRSAMVMEKER